MRATGRVASLPFRGTHAGSPAAVAFLYAGSVCVCAVAQDTIFLNARSVCVCSCFDDVYEQVPKALAGR